MRHRTAADLPFFNALLEVIHTDVSPYIAVHVHQNHVDASQIVTPGRKLIVMLNLSGDAAAFQTQCAFDKSVGKCTPILRWISRDVGIELTGCPAKFGRKINVLERLQLNVQSLDKHGPFLAHSDRRSRLTMCSGQHGNVFPFAGLAQ